MTVSDIAETLPDWMLIGRLYLPLFLTTPGSSGPSAAIAPLLGLYAISWAPSTLLNVERHATLPRWSWLLPQAQRLADIMTSMAGMSGADRRRLARILLLLLAGTVATLFVVAHVHLGQTVGFVVLGALGLIAVVALVWFIRTMGVPFVRDLRWYVRWKTGPEQTMDPGDLLDALGEQRTSRGACRLVADVRSARLLKPSMAANKLLFDLITATESTMRRVSLHDEAWSSPLTADWLHARGGERSNALQRFGSDFLDELGKLFEEHHRRG